MEKTPTSPIVDMFSTLWEVWKEMFSAFMDVFPKLLGFCLWAICGVVILPCVFIAGNMYPKWVEWGEEF